MKLLIALAIAAASTGAAAQNWIGLLKNTPAERFDDEDLRLFLDASRKALNDGAIGQAHAWDNPKTQARGEITVLRNFESKGRACKDVRVSNQVPGRKGAGTLSLCKVDDKWRLLSASQLKK